MSDEPDDLIPGQAPDVLPSPADEPRPSGGLRRTVVRLSPEDIARFDALRESFPGKSRAALIRAFCVAADPVPPESPYRAEVLVALAEVMEGQSRLARAEASVLSARHRLSRSVTTFNALVRSADEAVEVPPLAADAILFHEPSPRSAPPETGPAGTLRERIVALLAASPEKIFTPALVAAAIGEDNRNSIRNTLLVLAGKSRIEKCGEGRYRAREESKEP